MKKKNSTPTPHDATFRQFLTQPEIARDFINLRVRPRSIGRGYKRGNCVTFFDLLT